MGVETQFAGQRLNGVRGAVGYAPAISVRRVVVDATTAHPCSTGPVRR
jgi:hypothetical protein